MEDKFLNDIYLKYADKNKIEIATAFVWYHYELYGKPSNIQVINNYFEKSHLSKYNPTYLKAALKKSKNVISAGKSGYFKPSKDYIIKLKSEFDYLINKSEEIICNDLIIPKELYNGTRGYIINLCNQINASYENNIFDGCAILMRRLIEILLIHTYENTGNIDSIKENDGYKNLSYIINYTLSNKPFTLSKEIQELIDTFRILGNFSAHKIHYNAKKQYLDEVKSTYRLAIEELLYKSGLKI